MLFWAQWTEKILLMFPWMGFSSLYSINVFMSNFEVKVSQRYTSFGLYFAYEEYRTDDSNSPAERTSSPAES